PPAVRSDDPLVVGEQLAQVLLVATGGDLEHGDLLAERAPQRSLTAFQPPAGLVDVQRPGAAHLAEQLLVGLLERVTGAVQDRVDRTDRDAGAEQLLTQLNQVTTRDTVADRQRRDRRLQARPERATRYLGWQFAGALRAAARAAHPLAAMLGDQDRDLRQLLDLMTRRLPTRDPIRLGEHVTAPAPGRPVVDELVNCPRRQQVTTVPFMTRLPALRTTRAVLAAPAAQRRARWILARRRRRVSRVAPQPTLKLLDPRLKLRDPAVHREKHLDDRLPARVIDRL